MTMLFNNLTKDFERSLIGFDRMVRDTRQAVEQAAKSTFPFYNIIKRDEKTYVIEMAVAGFTKNEIVVELDGDLLRIKGELSTKPTGEYIFKGLSAKSFEKNFTISQGFEVKDVSLANGILKVFFEDVAKKKGPTRINISDDEPDTVSEFAANNPQLLTEETLSELRGKIM